MRSVLFMTIMLGVVLAGCQHIPFMRTPEDRAYDREYDLDRPHGRTPMGAKVIFPTWLAVKDRPQVVACVHSYLVELKRHFSRLEFYWDRLIIFIHNNMDWMVGGYGMRMRVYGWRCGRAMYVAWTPQDGAPRESDPLAVLPHEVMHAILEAKYGDSDPTHLKYYPTLEVRCAIVQSRARALPVKLSQESIDGAKQFEYNPWAPPRTVDGLKEIMDMIAIAMGKKRGK